MNKPAIPPDPPPRPCRVMLLSLWAAPNAAWHARIVGSDAQVHEFSSPLELARFVARLQPAPARQPPARDDAPGLR